MKNYLIVLCLLLATSINAQKKKDQPAVVDTVDRTKYLGLWYEIARSENFVWQKNMVGFTVDYYKIVRKGNKLKEHIHSYKKKLGGREFKMKSWIRFYDAAHFTDPLGIRQGVRILDSNYQYSVVGTNNRKYMWILCRTPQMDDATYNMILTKMKAMGYDTGKVKKYPQQERK